MRKKVVLAAAVSAMAFCGLGAAASASDLVLKRMADDRATPSMPRRDVVPRQAARSWARTSYGRRARRGWSNRHVQRMARKARNTARFKAARKGRR